MSPIQAQILELMKKSVAKLNIAHIIITHNLGVVARLPDRVICHVRRALAEQGPADAVFHRPRHPYTLGLLRSVPRLDRPRGSKLENHRGPAAKSGECLDRLSFRAALSPIVLRSAIRNRRCAHRPGGLSRCTGKQRIAAGKITWAAAGGAATAAAVKSTTRCCRSAT